MEIKITKNQIIAFCISVFMCIACFLSGRYLRFERVSGDSEQLISGIIQAGNNTDQIINELTIAGASAESAERYGILISGIIEELRNENDQLGISTNEAIRAIESNQRITELVKSASSSLHNTTGAAIDVAIKRAEDYEQLIESLQEALGNTSKDNN